MLSALLCLSFLISLTSPTPPPSFQALRISQKSQGFTGCRSPAANHISHLEYVLSKARGYIDTAPQHWGPVTNHDCYWPAGGDANPTDTLGEGENKNSTQHCSFSMFFSSSLCEVNILLQFYFQYDYKMTFVFFYLLTFDCVVLGFVFFFWLFL